MPLRWTAGGLVPDFSDSSDDEEKPCEVCANLDRHSVASWMRTGTNSFYIYDISPSALKAQDGICYTCTMVGGGLSQFRQDWAESDGKLRINVRGRDDYSRPLLVQLAKPAHNDDDDDDDGAIENDKENEDKGDNKGDKNSSPIKAAPVELVMELYADKDDEPLPWPAIGHGRHIYHDPTDDHVFELISGWINECRNSHTPCQPSPVAILTLPTRVIDVGSDDCPPKLHISNGEVEPYAALSHCWGGVQPLTTTSATIRSRVEGIIWDQLPKTFRETILITRKLGLKYLWIDSLCIIQDDSHDWEIESAKMSSVYKNSYVTISSTGFPNSGGGLLDERKSKLINLEGKVFYAREYLDHEQFAASDSSSQSATNQYPLFTRGWCFQERLLATRVLHYTRQGIFFECGYSARCECQCNPECREVRSFKWTFAASILETVNDAPDTAVDIESKIGLDAQADPEVDDELEGGDDDDDWSDVSDNDDPAALWDEIITNYSNKKLTFQKDNLVALSSVAGEWQKLGMGKYLAGLWENSLAAGLLWKSAKPLPVRFEADSYLAPTFSWASHVGPIKPYEFSERPTYHIRILEAECTPKGPNLFGQVSGGFIRLRGPLIMAAFHPASCMDCATMLWQNLNGGCHLRKSGYEAEYFDVDRSADAKMKKGESVYLLLVAMKERSGKAIANVNDGKNDDVSKGRRKAMVSNSAAVILRHTGDGDLYRRIGAAHDIDDGWFESAVEKEIVIL